MSMHERLVSLIDKPVVIKTASGARGSIGAGGQVQFRVDPVETTGVVFEVGGDMVDILVDGLGVMKTLRIDAIAEVSLSQFMARQMHLEDPPEHADYPRAKRLLFECEEALNLRQPRDAIAAKAQQAADLFRAVRKQFGKHRGVQRRLERAHFLATGKYDYELDESVTGGEVEDGNYAAAKEYIEKLDKALRARRPEGEVAVVLPVIARYSGRALGKYPNHADLKAWFEKAEKIRSKLSPETQKRTTYDADMRTMALDVPFVVGAM